MKIFIFFLLLALMLGGGVLIVCHKMDIDIGTSKVFAALGLGSGGGSIATTSEWGGILTGRWEFKTKFTEPREIWYFEGEVKYLPSGEFLRQMTVKYYHNQGHEPEMDDYDLAIVAGGTVKGKWRVDTAESVWKEIVLECAMKNSLVVSGFNNDYDACQWYNPLDKLNYGNTVENFGSSEVEEFSANEISIIGKNFDSGGKKSWVFKRLSN
ncbi:MAG: hypothetical protein ACK4Q5_05415 [Saprospiraceae bacterium]